MCITVVAMLTLLYVHHCGGYADTALCTSPWWLCSHCFMYITVVAMLTLLYVHHCGGYAGTAYVHHRGGYADTALCTST